MHAKPISKHYYDSYPQTTQELPQARNLLLRFVYGGEDFNNTCSRRPKLHLLFTLHHHHRLLLKENKDETTSEIFPNIREILSSYVPLFASLLVVRATVALALTVLAVDLG